MRYLVKVFNAKKQEGIPTYTPYLVTDDGDETTNGSLWHWLYKANSHGLSISVYRLTKGVESAKEWDQILIIDQEGKLIQEWASNLKLAELSQDSSVEAYIINCILDLS